jgi:hypothetical protein
LGSICGAWNGAARTSPAAVFGFSVGAGVKDLTGVACAMIGSGVTNDRVFGLAGWLMGTHIWFVPPLIDWP